MNYTDTPAEGATSISNEGFSSYGGTVYYYDAAGHALATPVIVADPAFSATDGDTTSVSSDFQGTSAAAPNAGAVAALVLSEDGRLTNTQVSYLLGSTAVRFGSSVNAGDGLIDADAAVGGASTAATTPIWTQQGSSTSWFTAANWSDNLVPTASDATTLGNGIGLFSKAYTVTIGPPQQRQRRAADHRRQAAWRSTPCPPSPRPTCRWRRPAAWPPPASCSAAASWT